MIFKVLDELREPAGKPEGKAWATRLPTTMTILQANSIGLEVKQALPCNCDDITTFENPEMLPCNDNFTLNTAQIGGTNGTAKLFGSITELGMRQAQVDLKTVDGLLEASTLTDSNGNWELNGIEAGTYKLRLDSMNAYNDADFIADGEKEQEVTLINNQTVEVNLSFSKRV